MRYPPDHKGRTRAGILASAARAFRERGYDGIGVDALAAEADLTSGALFKHFGSKGELFREVVRGGMERLRDGIARFQQAHPDRWLGALTEWYMGPEHRRDVRGGCGMPSLSPEVVRAGPETREEYGRLLAQSADAIAGAPPFRGADGARERAWAALALLAGGVTLSRAVADPALAEEIAEAVSKAVAGLEPAPLPARAGSRGPARESRGKRAPPPGRKGPG